VEFLVGAEPLRLDRAPHAGVIERTNREGWYAEELFARFGVLSTSGTLDGVDPLIG